MGNKPMVFLLRIQINKITMNTEPNNKISTCGYCLNFQDEDNYGIGYCKPKKRLAHCSNSACDDDYEYNPNKERK